MIAPNTLDIETICLMLSEYQKVRSNSIQIRMKIDQASEAYVNRFFGYSTFAPDKERKAAQKEAAKVIKGIRKGDQDTINNYPACASFIMRQDISTQPWKDLQKETEKEMIKLVKQLPIHQWQKSILGFGEIGLAIIVAECGNLSNYDNPAKVWKRMGMAVIRGQRQRRTTNAELAIEMGYNPHRRSAMFVIGDSMLKSQLRKVKDKDGEPTGETISRGELGEVYLKDKAYQLTKEIDGKPLTPIHAHRRAQRKMEKELLKQLWKAWSQSAHEPQRCGEPCEYQESQAATDTQCVRAS